MPTSGAAKGRTGRPPLTERRKAETRLDIARAAVHLFTTKGVGATTAEEIAAAGGVSLRTLWRYFPAKESCVLPLLAAGVQNIAHSLRTWPPGNGIAELLDDIEARAGDLATDLPSLMALVRLTRAEPALRAVWLQAHDDAEPVFAAALNERAGASGDSLQIHVQAAMINSALRAAVEHYAWRANPANLPDTNAGLLQVVRTALHTAAQGLPWSQR
jgi:AcrR family transcriptional regulator